MGRGVNGDFFSAADGRIMLAVEERSKSARVASGGIGIVSTAGAAAAA